MGCRGTLFHATLAAVLLAAGGTARAEIPEAVVKVIAAAEATGDPAKTKTVYDMVRAAYPDLKDELDLMEQQGKARVASAAEAKKVQARQETSESGFFTHWDGRGEIGAKHSTGNSDEIGLTASLLLRRTGVIWRHKLTARAEFESTDGDTTTENYFLAYQPSYEIGDDLFIYALAQYERDPIQSFSARYSVSGGLGYRPFERPDLRVEVKAGPAWREIHYIPEGGNSHFAIHVAADFEWRIATNLKFTETTGAYIQAGNQTFYSHTGLESGVGKGLKARLSYSFEYDTALPNNVKDVDTLSRFTLLYDF
ncbi:DUF481 domain-containing protein [Croceibacterium sp. LX-88]|uniref:DUF481 domain-containing protein n=1 Tax=Croceibacterium selenioxidans TaxID=2838833 RepID=A0ABS5W248_9SPHN|nr:DUF481 domain-containing protein [Croceibacterium selenioxidans]MBT2133818.1 DUF481 domain-containing protein [Croceibacterium selenioxidans]